MGKRHSELLEILKENISILSEKHDFTITDEEQLGILLAMKITELMGIDVSKTIKETILVIGMKKKYPELPIIYSFIFRN